MNGEQWSRKPLLAVPYTPLLVSERNPVPLAGIGQVADIGAEPKSHPGAHRCKNNPAVLLIVDGYSGHDVGASFDSWKAFKNGIRARQIVNKRKCPRNVGARVEARGRAGPIHLHGRALSLHIEIAVAVAQAHNKRTAAFIAGDVG